MNTYITGSAIRKFREARNLTQAQLADTLCISDKTVSKWETGKGLPDITLLEPLAKALGVSLPELLNGQQITNQNTACNVLRTKFYVCPVCGNVLTSMGGAMISCCGVELPQLEAEEPEGAHSIQFRRVEDELFLTVDHPMTKAHFISFLAFVTSDRIQFVKLYPEGASEARMKLRGRGILYGYCNRHGLWKQKV